MAPRLPGVARDRSHSGAATSTTGAQPGAGRVGTAEHASPQTASSQVAAVARGLGRAFGERRVIDGLELEIGPGEFIGLIGKSGSGKSTLLRALAGLDRQVTGELVTSSAVAMAFQEPRLLPWKRVWANVALGLRVSDRKSDPKAVALRALDEVGLSERADAWPLTLSGGEAQRASLARALVREPGLLLLDEPFSALDALTRISMHRLVLDLWARHRPAVLLVSHDVDEVLALADRVVVLADGKIAHESRIALDRPRDRDHPDLTALRIRLLTELGVAAGQAA